ncbi:hypothetical protein SynBIOSE41_01924 [Synechococcus sp. BIOS-E4-1]|nr:hypothetical protein SynBIOSE41_01924 [Synechococcus sp. BIOS-E4-1]
MCKLGEMPPGAMRDFTVVTTDQRLKKDNKNEDVHDCQR